VDVPAHDRSHYDAQFKQRGKVMREAAAADSTTKCWRCGLTLAEYRAQHPGREVSWHVDHVVPGRTNSPLRMAHSTCNMEEGGRNRHRVAGMNPSRRWY